MAREWVTKCRLCADPIRYSDHVFHARRRMGGLLPRLCRNCTDELLRERRFLPIYSTRLDARIGGVGDQTGPRHVPVPQSYHAAEDIKTEDPHKGCGIKKEQLEELYVLLDDPAVRVILAIAGTGSGKSTLLPFRIISPLESEANLSRPWDAFTRDGQVTITQPRIAAAEGIVGHVAKRMHGCSVGPGLDLGVSHSRNTGSDWETRLAYVTDGRLVNWIVRGDLCRIGLVIIDEAHERSMNIDLIMALLVEQMRWQPHFKVIIASATIDKEEFKRFFNKHLEPLGQRCEIQKFDSEKSIGYGNPFHRKAAQELPYDKDPKKLRKLASEIGEQLAKEIFQLLLRLVDPSRFDPGSGIPDLTQPDAQGDILGFVHGKKAIEQCEQCLNALLEQEAKEKGLLVGKVQIVRAHAAISMAEQKRIADRSDCTATYRVLIATNYAETSLTIPNLVHVVDSGLLYESRWDSKREMKEIPPVIHSRSGCRQRWGRVGRTKKGYVWTLYTEEQFFRGTPNHTGEELFREYTQPSVKRENVEAAILRAKQAGADQLDKDHFAWMDPPDTYELARADRRLRESHLLDSDGDRTRKALFLESFEGKAVVASLMAVADAFCCAIEMACIIPLVIRGPRDRGIMDDDILSRSAVAAGAVQAFRQSCQDDVEFALKLYAAYEDAAESGPEIVQSPAWEVAWRDRGISSLKNILEEVYPDATERETITGRLRQACTSKEAVHATADRFRSSQGSGRQVVNRLRDEIGSQFRRASQYVWAAGLAIDFDVFRKDIVEVRDALLKPLQTRLKGKEDRPVNLAFADRIRLILAWNRKTDSFREGGYDPDMDKVLYSPVASSDGDPPLACLTEQSVCDGRSPEFFVAIGWRANYRRSKVKKIQIRVLETSFAAVLDPGLFEQLANLDQMGLARLIAGRPDVLEDREGLALRVRTKLPLDVRLPIGARVRCRALGSAGQDRCQVEILELASPPSVCRRAGEPVETVDGENEEGAQGSPVLFPLAPPTIPEFGDSGEDTEQDEMARDNEEAALQRKVAPATSGDAMADGELFLRAGTPAPSRDSVHVAVIVGYTDGKDTGSAQRVLLEEPARGDNFDAFAGHFKVGDIVPVESIGHIDVLMREKALLVREPRTGFRAVMRDEDITLGVTRNAAQLIPQGAQIQPRLVEMDAATQTIRLSLAHLAEPIIDELLSADGFQPVSGLVVARELQNAILLLAQSDPPQGLIVLAQIPIHDNFDNDLAPSVGGVVRVLAYTSRNEVSANLNAIPVSRPDWIQVLDRFELSPTSDRLRIYTSQRIGLDTYFQLRADLVDQPIRQALGNLLSFSNAVRCRSFHPQEAVQHPHKVVGDSAPPKPMTDQLRRGQRVKVTLTSLPQRGQAGMPPTLAIAEVKYGEQPGLLELSSASGIAIGKSIEAVYTRFDGASEKPRFSALQLFVKHIFLGGYPSEFATWVGPGIFHPEMGGFFGPRRRSPNIELRNIPNLRDIRGEWASAGPEQRDEMRRTPIKLSLFGPSASEVDSAATTLLQIFNEGSGNISQILFQIDGTSIGATRQAAADVARPPVPGGGFRSSIDTFETADALAAALGRPEPELRQYLETLAPEGRSSIVVTDVETCFVRVAGQTLGDLARAFHCLAQRGVRGDLIDWVWLHTWPTQAMSVDTSDGLVTSSEYQSIQSSLTTVLGKRGHDVAIPLPFRIPHGSIVVLPTDEESKRLDAMRRLVSRPGGQRPAKPARPAIAAATPSPTVESPIPAAPAAPPTRPLALNIVSVRSWIARSGQTRLVAAGVAGTIACLGFELIRAVYDWDLFASWTEGFLWSWPLAAFAAVPLITKASQWSPRPPTTVAPKLRVIPRAWHADSLTMAQAAWVCLVIATCVLFAWVPADLLRRAISLPERSPFLRGIAWPLDLFGSPFLPLALFALSTGALARVLYSLASRQVDEQAVLPPALIPVLPRVLGGWVLEGRVAGFFRLSFGPASIEAPHYQIRRRAHVVSTLLAVSVVAGLMPWSWSQVLRFIIALTIGGIAAHLSIRQLSDAGVALTPWISKPVNQMARFCSWLLEGFRSVANKLERELKGIRKAAGF